MSDEKDALRFVGKLQKDLSVILWMAGINLAATMVLLWKVFSL